MRHEAPPPAADLQRVLDDELEYIRRNRHPDTDPEVVRRSFIGLAMSGGGIRSATTCLGMLQALTKMRILPMVDYVSTVSGGGYIGACMSALCSWNHNAAPTSFNPRAAFTFSAKERPAFSTDPEHFPFHPDYSPRPQRDVPPRDERLKEAKLHEAENKPKSATPVTTKPTQEEIDAILRARGLPPHPRAANGLIAHLRTHGNFLIAHRGLFKREALRGIGALTIGGMYNALGFLLILLSASALYLTTVLALAPALPQILSSDAAVVVTDTTRHALMPADSAVTRTRTTGGVCPPTEPGCVGETKTTFRPASTWDHVKRNLRAAAVVFTNPQPISGPHEGSFLDDSPGFSTTLAPILLALFLGAISAIVILAGIADSLAAYVRGVYAPTTSGSGDSVEDKFERHVLRRSTWGLLVVTLFALLFGKFLWRDVFKPEDQIVWLFVPFATLTGAWIVSFFASTVFLPWFDHWTRRFRSLTSAFYAITSWGWWFTLAFAIGPIFIYALRSSPTGLGLGAIGSLLASRLLSGRSSGSSRFSLSPGALRILLGIVVLLVMVFGELLFATLLTMYFDNWRQTAWIAGIGATIITFFGWVANHNKLGPQYFYRDRLSETYLFSELPDEDGKLRVFHDAMEMPLDCLHGQPNDAKSGWKNPAPYHIINAAINLAGSRDLTRKDRKSGYWLFSKLYCGSTHTGFRETSKYRGGSTKLANAISISGAAASSGIGKDTFFAQAFATVLFNIRLGAWLENPAHASSISGTEIPVFWPRYLVREALMDTTESAARVNLSDGGHTGDNVGLYPLLQRRCKVIIVCDAERDPALTFGSFTEALRQAYIDMGVDVDIDLTMIRPNPETGLSRSHCAVGRIHYPDRPDQESTLIYIKNSMMGDEPEPVLNYKIKCSDFPHESTVDQFFDDAQFESYRALGVHITEHTFGRWAHSSGFETASTQHAHAGA